MTVLSVKNVLIAGAKKLYEGTVDNQSDLANVPADAGEGSIFHTVGYGSVWEKKADGTWVQL